MTGECLFVYRHICYVYIEIWLFVSICWHLSWYTFYFVDGVLQCDWFFSSWDEDVNVPVDEVPPEPVPISGMSEQLLAKAESLGKPRASLLITLTSWIALCICHIHSFMDSCFTWWLLLWQYRKDAQRWSTLFTQDSSALSQRSDSCFTRPIALHKFSSMMLTF